MPTTVKSSAARRSRQVAVLAGVALALGACAPGAAGPSPTAAAATDGSAELPVAPLNRRDIPAPSLEGNLLGDPTEREVWVYLPPQYFASQDPLPVVYYLPGFGESLMEGVSMPGDLETAFASVAPMIVVVVPGVTAVGGSFYVDSAANGDWETFVTQDVVEYVDESFRTVPAAEARGISGSSMGGFGAINLGMRHPDVFGAVYAATPGILDDGGVAEMGFFDSDRHVGEALDVLDGAAALDGPAVRDALAGQSYAWALELAYGLAFSASPEPPYIDYPFTRVAGAVARDDAVWSAWEAGLGDWDQKVVDHRDDLASLSGIAFECAEDDEYAWIPEGCAYLDAQLTAAGIDHRYTVTTGGHEDRTGTRMLDGMLPFMAEHLAGDATG